MKKRYGTKRAVGGYVIPEIMPSWTAEPDYAESWYSAMSELCIQTGEETYNLLVEGLEAETEDSNWMLDE